MKDYFYQIEEKLKKNLKLEKLEIIDNSDKHKKHKFYSANKYHLKLKIKSVYLSSISRINAQKIVMKVLKEDLNTKIHALEISIDK